ncbi:unnamed protein product [Spirodela intermedia]|uniref:AP-1 complex subunit gamma n=1 Tax=Spirodela intermedia TaxID=51605 RepID=A0A7I8IID5_SPIIN|nr:unnamed protein product [Spirodela intermedia]CAA6657612.1 unnamed protein product [Spirodela intermedia]
MDIGKGGYDRAIRACKTAAEERAVVRKECANSIQISQPFQSVYRGPRSCALGNICSAEMAHDLAPEVERLLQIETQTLRRGTFKGAALCSIRIIRKVPDLAENFMGPAASLLKEKHHGVLIAGIQLCTDLCKASNCTDVSVRILKDVSNSAYAPEYDVAGITDPFLHIRVLRLMHMLGQDDADASEYMNDILAQVKCWECHLYECVETIMGIEATSGLRVLAINILGRFLSNRDNNISSFIFRLALDKFSIQCERTRNCDSDASIRKRALELIFLLVNETNMQSLTQELIDYLVVSDQDFKEDLAAKICSIVEKFSPEKLWYIDQMLKVLSEINKLFFLVGWEFVKDEVWHALIVVISNAPELHGYTVRSLFKALQTSCEEKSLVRVAVWCIGEYGDMLINNVGVLGKEETITVAESDVIDVVEIALKRHSSDVTTRAMSLVALLKLSSRFPTCSERIQEIMIQQKGSLVLELQQRSIEFNSIIQKHQNIRSSVVERMPVLDMSTYNLKRAGSSPASIASEKATQTSSSGASIKLPNGVNNHTSAPLVDLLDLSSDDIPQTNSSTGDFLHDLLGMDLTTPSSTGKPAAASGGVDILMDLLSVGTPSVPTDKTKPNPGVSPVVDLLDGFNSNDLLPREETPAFPSITAFQSSSLKITFQFSKQPGKPQVTVIQATFTNLSSNDYTDFLFQAAVPKLHLDPASSNILPANGKGAVTQSLSLTNSQHGQKALAMRMRLAYKVNNQDTLEQGQISNFPPGL